MLNKADFDKLGFELLSVHQGRAKYKLQNMIVEEWPSHDNQEIYYRYFFTIDKCDLTGIVETVADIVNVLMTQNYERGKYDKTKEFAKLLKGPLNL